MATARECIKKVILENARGRKLAFVEEFKTLEEFLSYEGVEPDLHITMKKENVDNVFYCDFAILDKKNDEYYVVIPFEITEEISNILDGYGYELINDYCYLQSMHKRVSGVKNYTDGFNNRCNYVPANIHITFAGTNAKIYIAENVYIGDSVEITTYDDVELYLGEYSSISGNLELHNRTKVKIGRKVSGQLQVVTWAPDSQIIIGDHTTFAGRTFFHCHNGRIEIGEDCMFAIRNTLICGDGHAVFDVNTGSIINMGHDRNEIIFGDHIWVGQNSIVLSKTKIASGSIVGAGSVVKGKFPNNCVVASNPAKVKKKDVFWCRNSVGNIKDSEKKFFKKTVIEEKEI